MELTEEDKELLALKKKMVCERSRDALMGVARMMVLVQETMREDYGLQPESVPAGKQPQDAA